MQNIGFLKVINLSEDFLKSSNLIFFFSFISGNRSFNFWNSQINLFMWLNVNISSFIGKELSTEVFKKTLFIPYEEIIKGNTSSKIVTTVSFTNLLVDSIYSFFAIISSFIITIGIILGLSSIGFIYLISISFLLVIYYLVIILKFKNSVNKLSVARAESNKNLVKLMQESYGTIENIILEQSQSFFVKNL